MHVPTVMPIKVKEVLENADFDFSTLTAQDIINGNYFWRKRVLNPRKSGKIWLYLVQKGNDELFHQSAKALMSSKLFTMFCGHDFEVKNRDFSLFFDAYKKLFSDEDLNEFVHRVHDGKETVPPLENYDELAAEKKHGKWPAGSLINL
ncbi:Uncharacterised protein [uncultured archaeon]|nr:Uncharacterised protein [uncultured archaeon]